MDKQSHTGPIESLLTIKEVGELLKIGRTTIYELRREGKLPFLRIGRTVRFRADDVRFLINQGSRAHGTTAKE